MQEIGKVKAACVLRQRIGNSRLSLEMDIAYRQQRLKASNDRLQVQRIDATKHPLQFNGDRQRDKIRVARIDSGRCFSSLHGVVIDDQANQDIAAVDAERVRQAMERSMTESRRAAAAVGRELAAEEAAVAGIAGNGPGDADVGDEDDEDDSESDGSEGPYR